VSAGLALAAALAAALAPCPAQLAPYAALLRVTTAQGTFEEYEVLDRAGDGTRAWRSSHAAVPADPAPAFDVDRCLVDGDTLVPLTQQFRAGETTATLRRNGDALVIAFGDAQRAIAADGVYADWSCLLPLLLALPLREGAVFEATVASPMLAAGASNDVPRQRFEIGPSQLLDMPWGKERAWPVTQSGAGAPTLRHWLRARAPHARLRVEFVDAPGLGSETLAVFEPPGVSSARDCPASAAP
jgi:hypothetical protein